jgi:7-cyano-7-deazaguanine synthase in queuosine biosynthesis
VTRYELRFEEPDESDADPARTFFWTTSDDSTIDGRLFSAGRIGPQLGALGPVTQRNIDLVRIAVAVFAADRSTPRKGGGSSWNRRPIQVTVPVLDPAAWSAVADQLKAVVDLLSGDDWTFSFIADASAAEEVAELNDDPRRVVLLSGGADSAIGALRSRSELADDESHILVSHWTSSVLPGLQREIADAVATRLPGPGQRHVQAKLARRARTASGAPFRDEQTQRSRSLLFVALGLAVASINCVPVWIPENGYASLNPPIGPERLGSVSTRTTHPAFVTGLRELLRAVGAHGDIANPFAQMTKGEMFRWAADLLGDEPATSLLSATHSCAHTGQRTFHVSTKTACGVCFGCLVRRASFLAADLEDRTEYADGSSDPELARWLEEKSLAEAIRRFVARGISRRDIIAMGLPSDIRMADARELCHRGLAELALLG